MEKMVGDSVLVFCFPYRNGHGGVNNLFLRLAAFLHKNGHAVYIVDYPNGEMAKHNDCHIPLIPYFDDQKVSMPENAICIFQAMTPWSIYPSLNFPDTAKLLFIATLPVNFFPLLPGKLRALMSQGGRVAKFFWSTVLLSEFIKVRDFIKLLSLKKSLVFLDGKICKDIESSLNLDIQRLKIIPLFGEEAELYDYKSKINPLELNFAWLGRLADFKISILNKVIDDTYVYAEKNKVKINFTIVGTGELKSKVKKVASKYFCCYPIDSVATNNLNSFLQEFDCLFAMGTSALEGARSGVPTVRLDYSFKSFIPSYKYSFFHDITDFCMGENIDGCGYAPGKYEYEDLLATLINNHEKISRACYMKYVSNHVVSEGSSLLLQYASEAEFTWQDLKESRCQSSWFFRLWKKIRALK